VLIAGTVLYAGASVPAALPGNATVLIAGLAGTGVGAAVLTPASLAIVTESFRGERRGMAVGLWGAATALFSGIGPAIGGLLTQEASWRWILWLNVIVGAAILLGVRGTAESRDEDASPRIDYTGLALCAGGLGALTLALNEAPSPWAFASPAFLLVLCGGALALGGFVLLEGRLRAPLIDVRMFARRNLTGASVVVFALDFSFGATLFFLPLFLQEQRGYGALKSGLLLLPASATMMLAMPLGGRLFERYGPTAPILAGLTLSGAAMLLLAQISVTTRYAQLWLPLALLGLGVGAALTPLNLAALNSMPRRNPWRDRRRDHDARGPRRDLRRGAVGGAVRSAADESHGPRRRRARAAPRGLRGAAARRPDGRHPERDAGAAALSGRGADGRAGSGAQRLQLRVGRHDAAVGRDRRARDRADARAGPPGGPDRRAAAAAQRGRSVLGARAAALMRERVSRRASRAAPRCAAGDACGRAEQRASVKPRRSLRRRHRSLTVGDKAQDGRDRAEMRA
jgi:MFS family permease